jgi:methyl-accepting chemotaxis protein
MIDKVLEEEKKVALNFSIDPDIIAAAAAISDKNNRTEEKTGATKAISAKVEGNEVSSGSEAMNRVNAKLKTFMQTKGLGDSYQLVTCIAPDGVPFAASDPIYLGVNVGEREYFKNALAGQVNAGEVGLNKATSKPFAPFAAPIRSGDRIVGVVAVIADIGFLGDLVAGEKIGVTGYAGITDPTGLVIAHRVKEYVFSLNMAKTEGMSELAKRMMAGQEGVISYALQGAAKTAGFAPVKTTGWSVFFALPDSEYLSAANDVKNLIFLISAVALVLAFLIYLAFSRTITKPLAKGVAFAELVASGDFTTQLAVHQSDEIGKLAEALNGMSAKLKDMVATVQDSAEQVASSSEEITASAQKLAEGAQSQATTLEETSASVEELTSSVDQVAGHAQNQAAATEQGTASMAQVHKSIEEVSENLNGMSKLAKASVDGAIDGAKAVQQVVDGINLIVASSEKIGGIVNVISDIADQTNLLALNASIEAARAGEHGRGFAVVADEVSKLADRSAASTKEIESLIKESVKNVTEGVKTARGAQTMMEQISSGAQKAKETIDSLSASMSQQVEAVKELSKALSDVSEMSQSISAATEEQTTNAKQVSKAVEDVNEVTQSAASAAEEMSSATEQLASMAQELQQLMAQFKIDGEGATKGSTATRDAAGKSGHSGGANGNGHALALVARSCRS